MFKIINSQFLTKTISKRYYSKGIEQQFNNPIFKMWSTNHCIKETIPDDKVYIFEDKIMCHPQISAILKDLFCTPFKIGGFHKHQLFNSYTSDSPINWRLK